MFDPVTIIPEAPKGNFYYVLLDSANNIYYASGFIATENPAFIIDAVFQTAGTADQYISQDKMINSEMELIGEEKELVYY